MIILFVHLCECIYINYFIKSIQMYDTPKTIVTTGSCFSSMPNTRQPKKKK